MHQRPLSGRHSFDFQVVAQESAMKELHVTAIAVIAGVLTVLGCMALAQQDKYTLTVPGGLAFSEFRGYEGWQVVATSQNDKLVAVILANPVMIDAYLAGVPGNGKPFPDGSKMADRKSTRLNSSHLGISYD